MISNDVQQNHLLVVSRDLKEVYLEWLWLTNPKCKNRSGGIEKINLSNKEYDKCNGLLANSALHPEYITTSLVGHATKMITTLHSRHNTAK